MALDAAGDRDGFEKRMPGLRARAKSLQGGLASRAPGAARLGEEGAEDARTGRERRKRGRPIVDFSCAGSDATTSFSPAVLGYTVRRPSRPLTASVGVSSVQGAQIAAGASAATRTPPVTIPKQKIMSGACIFHL
jgi:hypothetical protein